MLHDLYLSTEVVQHAITAQDKIIKKIAANGSCVLVGRAADHVLRDCDNVVRIFIYAPKAYRKNRVMEIYGDSPAEAERNIMRSDKARAAYYKSLSGSSWGDRKNYELMIDSSVGVEQTAQIILTYLSQRA